MIIINYLDFKCNLLENFSNYFLIGKEISLINDIETNIIKYYINKPNLKIYRNDLNLQFNINEYKKILFLKEIFPVFNVLIFNADEKLITSYKIKKNLLLLNNIKPKNNVLIVKSHFINDFCINVFMEDDIYKTINPLIINCKINNNLVEVKNWLLLKLKKNNLKISKKIYNTLYELYQNDIDTLSHIIKMLLLNKNIKQHNVKKILLTQLKSFSISELFSNLLEGKIHAFVKKILFFKNNNEDIIIQLFNDIKNVFINLTKVMYLGYNYSSDLLDKLSKLITLKKMFKIINLLNKIDLFLIQNVYLSNTEIHNFLYDKLILLSILIIK